MCIVSVSGFRSFLHGNQTAYIILDPTNTPASQSFIVCISVDDDDDNDSIKPYYQWFAHPGSWRIECTLGAIMRIGPIEFSWRVNSTIKMEISPVFQSNLTAPNGSTSNDAGIETVHNVMTKVKITIDDNPNKYLVKWHHLHS